MTTRELIEAVNPEPEKWDSALGFENLVAVEDYTALVAATRAVLDECIERGHRDGCPAGIATGFDCDCGLANARALREKLR